jgi:asparagine N-glycosylation enzyme membrane subunit Stt3
MLILAAAFALVSFLLRRSLWRAVMRGTLFVTLLTVGIVVAVVMAGQHWPWIAAATVLLLTAGATWRVVRWAHAVRAMRTARVVWFGWQLFVDIWDARAVARSSRPLPPRST